MQGSLRLARRHLDESLAVAERQGARFEHAQTLLARGRVGLEAGWPDAQADLAAGPAGPARPGRRLRPGRGARQPEAREKPATLSLVDRFDTVLDAGRRIASALSRKTIFAEVRDAAARLLRGERCLLLEHHADEPSEI